MAWVRPEPKPADKLESVKWEEDKRSGPPWKQLKALTREKKVQLQDLSPRIDCFAKTRPCPALLPCHEQESVITILAITSNNRSQMTAEICATGSVLQNFGSGSFGISSYVRLR